MSLPRVNVRTIASVLIVAVLFLAIVPFAAVSPMGDAPACDADPSLSLILQDAHARNLQFGTEHVYTYGPLGFTTFFLFAPRYAGAHILVDVALALVASIGLWLVAVRLPIWMRVLLLGGFAWAAVNIHPRTDLIIETTLLCFGLLCVVESGPRLLGCVVAFVLIATFSALSKNSFLFSAPTSVVLVSAVMWSRGQRSLGLSAVIGLATAFAAGWLLAGQSLVTVPRFVWNALTMVKAYNEALGWETSIGAARAGIAVIAFLMAAVVIRTCSWCCGESAEPREASRIRSSGGALPSRYIVLVWLIVAAFAAWKHGFVRAHAGNVQMFFAYAAVLAIAVQILTVCKSVQVVGLVAGLGCWLIAAASLQTLYFAPLISSVSAVTRAVVQNWHTLADSSRYLERMNSVIAEHGRKAQLPQIREHVGNARVDVFGQQQAYAIYNQFAYEPRPVPQSYAVCSAALMNLNESYYLSRKAPEYVLFALDPLDRKFPPLEDARVLRTLLFNYKPVLTEEPFLLLRLQKTSAPPVRILHEQIVHVKEAIDLRSYGSNTLWIEIELTPTLAGRVRQVLLRPAMVRLTAYDVPGGKPLLRKRSPVPMLSAGFVASPLLANTADVLSFYEGGPAMRPGAYSVECDAANEWCWRAEIVVKVYGVGDGLKLEGGDAEQQGRE